MSKFKSQPNRNDFYYKHHNIQLLKKKLVLHNIILRKQDVLKMLFQSNFKDKSALSFYREADIFHSALICTLQPVFMTVCVLY